MSQLSLKKIKLGDNADLSKNFVISVPAVADGTLTIERENGADIITVAANGAVTGGSGSTLVGNVPVLHVATPLNKSVASGLDAPTEASGYNAPLIDTENWFNTTTGRYTPQVAGYYSVSATGCYYSSSITATSVGVDIIKNGVVYTGVSNGVISGFPSMEVTSLVYLNGTNDYISVGLRHNAASTYPVAGGVLDVTLVRAA